MNEETAANRDTVQQNNAELESTSEQSTNQLAELSTPDMGLPRENPRPLSNPKITVQS